MAARLRWRRSMNCSALRVSGSCQPSRRRPAGRRRRPPPAAPRARRRSAAGSVRRASGVGPPEQHIGVAGPQLRPAQQHAGRAGAGLGVGGHERLDGGVATAGPGRCAAAPRSPASRRPRPAPRRPPRRRPGAGRSARRCVPVALRMQSSRSASVERQRVRSSSGSATSISSRSSSRTRQSADLGRGWRAPRDAGALVEVGVAQDLHQQVGGHRPLEGVDPAGGQADHVGQALEQRQPRAVLRPRRLQRLVGVFEVKGLAHRILARARVRSDQSGVNRPLRLRSAGSRASTVHVIARPSLRAATRSRERREAAGLTERRRGPLGPDVRQVGGDLVREDRRRASPGTR